MEYKFSGNTALKKSTPYISETVLLKENREEVKGLHLIQASTSVPRTVSSAVNSFTRKRRHTNTRKLQLMRMVI